MVEAPFDSVSEISYFDQGLDEFAACLQDFELDFRQLGNGEFRARTSLIDLRGVQLARRSTSVRHAVLGTLPDRIIFYFPLKQLRIFANGHLVRADMQLVSVGRLRLFSIVPDSYEHLLVTIDPAELRRLLDPPEVKCFVELATAMDRCQINPQRKLAITHQLLDIYSAILNRQQPCSAGEARQQRSAIIRLLFDYLRAHTDLQRVQASTQERLLQRVLQHVESHAPQVPSLEELSHEVFASKRAIQYAFESIVGISPMRYIKLHRLNLVRRELQSRGPEATITTIVTRYGFSNPARLVREYTELFGERPRDTAARQVPQPGHQRLPRPAASVRKKSTS